MEKDIIIKMSGRVKLTDTGAYFNLRADIDGQKFVLNRPECPSPREAIATITRSWLIECMKVAGVPHD